MGRIFTYEEIAEHQRDPNGSAVPKPLHFMALTQAFTADMTSCQSVLAAMYYGSVLAHIQSPRSDFDALIIAKDGSNLDVIEVLRVLTTQFPHLPQQIIVLGKTQAENGWHAFDSSFGAHILWASKQGGVIKENPFMYLRLPERNPLEDVFQYATLQALRITKYAPVRTLTSGFYAHGGRAARRRIKSLLRGSSICFTK